MRNIKQKNKKSTQIEAESDEIYIQEKKRVIEAEFKYLRERLLDNFLIDTLDYNYPAALRKIIENEIVAFSFYEYYLLLSAYVQKILSVHKFSGVKHTSEDYVINRFREIFPGLELKLNTRDSVSKGKIAIKVLATQFRTSPPTIERLLKQAKHRAQWLYNLEPMHTSTDLIRAFYSLIMTRKYEAEQKLNCKLKRKPFENNDFLEGYINARSEAMEILTKMFIKSIDDQETVGNNHLQE